MARQLASVLRPAGRGPREGCADDIDSVEAGPSTVAREQQAVQTGSLAAIPVRLDVIADPDPDQLGIDATDRP